MKVKELIKELSKMPQNADVYTCDHDQSAWETNGIVSNVYYINQKKDFPVGSHDWEALEKDSYFKIDKPYVVIKV